MNERNLLHIRGHRETRNYLDIVIHFRQFTWTEWFLNISLALTKYVELRTLLQGTIYYKVTLSAFIPVLKLTDTCILCTMWEENIIILSESIPDEQI